MGVLIMGTRAIYCMKYKIGYLGAWQWLDANNIRLDYLNRHFNNRVAVLDFLKQGEWDVMGTRKNMQSILDGCKATPYRMTECNGVYFVKRPESMKKAPVFYKDLETLLGQDVNFVFMFDSKTHKWKKQRTY